MPNYRLIDGIHIHEGVRYQSGTDMDIICDLSEESAERIGLHRLNLLSEGESLEEEEGTEVEDEAEEEQEQEEETETVSHRTISRRRR